MRSVVVDSSVVIKWFVPEVNSKELGAIMLWGGQIQTAGCSLPLPLERI